MLFTNRVYTKHQDIHDQEFLGSRDSFIPHSRVQFNIVCSQPPIIEISSLLDRNPLKHNNKSKIVHILQPV